MSTNKLPIIITVRGTQEQRDRFKQAATLRGVSLNQFMIDCAEFVAGKPLLNIFDVFPDTAYDIHADNTHEEPTL